MLTRKKRSDESIEKQCDTVHPHRSRRTHRRVCVHWRVCSAKQSQCQPWRNHQRHHERQQHSRRCIDWNWPHIRPEKALHERHRQQRGNYREGRKNGRAAYFVHCQWNRLNQRHVVQCTVPMNVLDDHDGIVHQNADGEDQRKQRHTVDGETHEIRRSQGQRQRQHHCRAHHQCFTAAQRKQHQPDHRQRGEQ